MDINKEYAAHQHAMMRAGKSCCSEEARAHFAQASSIATRIAALQRELGAAAACDWNITQVSAPARA